MSRRDGEIPNVHDSTASHTPSRCDTSTDGARWPSEGGEAGLYEGDTEPVRLILKIARRVHISRFLTGARRAELILAIDDLLAEIHRLEVLAGERR